MKNDKRTIRRTADNRQRATDNEKPKIRARGTSTGKTLPEKQDPTALWHGWKARRAEEWAWTGSKRRMRSSPRRSRFTISWGRDTASLWTCSILSVSCCEHPRHPRHPCFFLPLLWLPPAAALCNLRIEGFLLMRQAGKRNVLSVIWNQSQDKKIGSKGEIGRFWACIVALQMQKMRYLQCRIVAYAVHSADA